VELRPEDIAEIVRIFNDSELEELRLEIGGSRLYLSKQAGRGPAWEQPAGSASPAPPRPSSETAVPPAAATIAPPSSAGSEPGAAELTEPGAPLPAGSPLRGPERTDLVELKSPLLGVFYRRPAPDKPPFVEIGSEVGPDDPVCIIDVMKMFSRVPAGVAGRVAEILVEDGQLVEHGQVLMRLEPR
jgi:acetyl-CoA carboxylase biotin carboxyl carrier protein